MQSETFKHWLAERGCTFDEHKHAQGRGPANLTVHCGDRQSVLPMVGTRNDLDPEVVRRIVDDLGLDWSELPGPQSRV